ncbi:class I fructose-bisphosphate aldolase [Undibacterium sp. RuRC25W]|uniref:class I fructose-bisphosphate aldolase n=1 Tax=Undibacterium sp. RuRC25W TaxID=3413047 RepID=UPI003BF0711D
MQINSMRETVQTLFANNKGILAMDESNATCNQRFIQLDIPPIEESRRLWRELILTTPELHKAIGGVILFDETTHQHQLGGTSFLEILRKSGIRFGIKVDHGIHPLALHPLEQMTYGLDGLRERLVTYASVGASFAKWRATLTISDQLPSDAAINNNAHALAAFAALCQENAIVPIVEPEVLMAGSHTIERCQRVTEDVLRAVFRELDRQGVSLDSVILKSNMVLSGNLCPVQATIEDVAQRTIDCLLNTVPAAVPVVAFLSGGQTAEQASTRLNAMSLLALRRERSDLSKKKLPWEIAFSFARAIQCPALELWHGLPEQRVAAQHLIFQQACDNQLARQGLYHGPSPSLAARS